MTIISVWRIEAGHAGLLGAAGRHRAEQTPRFVLPSRRQGSGSRRNPSVLDKVDTKPLSFLFLIFFWLRFVRERLVGELVASHRVRCCWIFLAASSSTDDLFSWCYLRRLLWRRAFVRWCWFLLLLVRRPKWSDPFSCGRCSRHRQTPPMEHEARGSQRHLGRIHEGRRTRDREGRSRPDN